KRVPLSPAPWTSDNVNCLLEYSDTVTSGPDGVTCIRYKYERGADEIPQYISPERLTLPDRRDSQSEDKASVTCKSRFELFTFIGDDTKEHAIEALHKAKFKFPGCWKINTLKKDVQDNSRFPKELEFHNAQESRLLKKVLEQSSRLKKILENPLRKTTCSQPSED
ncbi:hypothetical protein A6R68_09479, partial [Neotoma lepida]